MLKFHIFILLTCEESLRIHLICEELVPFFSDVKIGTHVKNWYSIFTNVKNRYEINTHVKNSYQIVTCEKLVPNYHRCKVLVLDLHRSMSMTECVTSCHM